MLRVGLTGGMACGKSFVGQAFAKLGCHLIQADELGHEVLLPHGEAFEGVVREFGRDILEEGGRIDRRKLAALVFKDKKRLAKLNALVHPAVILREEELISKIAEHDPHGIVMVEAAILVETGSYKRFDRLVVVMCNEEQQFARAMEREGAAPNIVKARLKRQMPLQEKRKYADYVIDTSGSKEDTLRQVRDVYRSLRSIA